LPDRTKEKLWGFGCFPASTRAITCAEPSAWGRCGYTSAGRVSVGGSVRAAGRGTQRAGDTRSTLPVPGTGRAGGGIRADSRTAHSRVSEYRCCLGRGALRRTAPRPAAVDGGRIAGPCRAHLFHILDVVDVVPVQRTCSTVVGTRGNRAHTDLPSGNGVTPQREDTAAITCSPRPRRARGSIGRGCGGGHG
jgi:hypothetical protein